MDEAGAVQTWQAVWRRTYRVGWVTGFTFLLGGCAVSMAQQPSTSLTGRVIEATTEAPLESVHVFIDGTTLGDVTDAQGQFRLAMPLAQSFLVVVSMLGFQIETVKINRATFNFEPLVLELKPSILALDEVEVVAERPRRWHRDLKRFKQLLFSTTPLGRGCAIENPNVLDLSSSSSTGALTARAEVPLVIFNRALGYRVTVHAFHLEGTERFYNWQGQVRFRELTPEDDRQQRRWEERRRQAYEGSRRHFLYALAQGRLRDEGFEAYLVRRAGETSVAEPVREMDGRQDAPPILYGANDAVSRTIVFTGSLYVRYRREHALPAYQAYMRKYAPRTPGTTAITRYQSSWFVLPMGQVMIDTLGQALTVGDAFPLTHYGYWAWERLGEMLPSDYRPPR